ncbi:MAG: nodulation protein NfeD [Pseudomonadota bacterium]|nr:nodulation protein NfeD [Pseudomonadota bacterium]
MNTQAPSNHEKGKRTFATIARAALLLGVALAGLLGGAATRADGSTALLLDVDGAIGPATAAYVEDGIELAASTDATAVILRMDTPGGLDQSMRGIVKSILSSSVPVIAWVAPSGARAASAGTYILYAAHIAAMAPATTLGAATPVSIGGLPGIGGSKGKEKRGTETPEDRDGADVETADDATTDSGGSDTMNRKIVNDAAAYIKGLARQRGRNEAWAELAVREAVSLTAIEAREQDVIDFVAGSIPDLLRKVDGREVDTASGKKTLNTGGVTVLPYAPDWRTRLLSVITNPNVAYILMLIGIYGLIFELSNPGAVFPGVIGAICLLLALYAFQVLPINYAGLALMILGIAFMVSEAFVPSFGVLGLGGVIAFVAGSVILLDEDQYSVSLPLIVGTALISAGFFLWVIARLVRLRGRRPKTGAEEMIGLTGITLSPIAADGRVRVHSETWNARSVATIPEGQPVRVTGMNGLLLDVEAIAPGPDSGARNEDAV